jgi:hypothetical protein
LYLQALIIDRRLMAAPVATWAGAPAPLIEPLIKSKFNSLYLAALLSPHFVSPRAAQIVTLKIRAEIKKERNEMNGIEEYRRVIQELCEFTGMSHWEEVAAAQHIEVDGTTVGIIAEEGPDACRLCLYFDLGVTGQSPDIYRSLLEANLTIQPEEPGYFGSHPESGAVVFRVNVPLTRNSSGLELAMQIQESLGAGRDKLAQLKSGAAVSAPSPYESNGAVVTI